MDLKNIKLSKGKEINLQRKHPWIFSGAIRIFDPGMEDGDLVQIFDFQENYLGFGHFHNGSIAVKILGFAPEIYSKDFFRNKLLAALNLRQSLSLPDAQTNCYRWIHGEGDGLPGLIIDVYDQLVVIQCHTIGMHRLIEELAESVASVLPGKILTIVDKSKECLPLEYAKRIENTILRGSLSEFICSENGIHFMVDPLSGQKTGFFLDQRENRQLLAQYAPGKNLLNVFCYTGGFSLYALKNGAKQVTSIDASKRAIEGLEKNLELNKMNFQHHYSVCDDAIHFLKNIGDQSYDLIILDPPAFAKSINKRHQAIQAYKRINELAMRGIQQGGLLFTFSCSQVVSEELFYNTIVAAGIESGRKARVLHRLSQGPDHPVSLFHPEGSYLKGLVIYLE